MRWKNDFFLNVKKRREKRQKNDENDKFLLKDCRFIGVVLNAWFVDIVGFCTTWEIVLNTTWEIVDKFG